MEQSKIKKEVWETIQALNRAWAEDVKVVGNNGQFSPYQNNKEIEEG